MEAVKFAIESEILETLLSVRKCMLADSCLSTALSALNLLQVDFSWHLTDLIYQLVRVLITNEVPVNLLHVLFRTEEDALLDFLDFSHLFLSVASLLKGG